MFNTGNKIKAKKDILHPKFRPLNKSLKYAIQEHKSKFDYILRQLKDTAKSNLSIQKIADIEALAIYTISIDSDIEKIVTWVEKKATEVNIEELMIKDNGASYSDILVKAFNCRD